MGQEFFFNYLVLIESVISIDYVTMDRRTFTKSAFLSALAAAAPVKIFADDAKGASIKFRCKPYLQNPKPDSITVMWLVDKPSFSWVELAEGSARLPKEKFFSQDDGLYAAGNTINKIEIGNLKAGTTYSYKVVSREILTFEAYKVVFGEQIESEVFTFKTPEINAKDVSLIIFNDIHNTPKSFAELLKLNNSEHFDFAFYNGDMLNYLASEEKIVDCLIKPSAETFASQTPFLYLRGNHETRGSLARTFKDYFALPATPYFSFTWGPAFFMALDTGEDKPDSAEVYAGLVAFDEMREREAKWLEAQMQSAAYKNAKFRIALMHIPTHYSNDWHGTLECKKLFTPIFNKYKLDMAISGHNHKYAVRHPIKNDHDYPIVIGGGPKTGQRTLIKLKISETTLDLKMLCDNGEQVGEYKIVR